MLDILQRHGTLCNSTHSDVRDSLVCDSARAHKKISLTSASVAVSATHLKVSYYT